MTVSPALLFYLAVLALVVGCFVYLRSHRGEGAREVIVQATYPLEEWATILGYEDAFESLRSTVVSLEFSPGEDGPRVIVGPGEMILVGFYPGPLAKDLLRRGAARAGLEAPEDLGDNQYSVAFTGTRPEMARKIAQVLQDLYQVDGGKAVDVSATFQGKANPGYRPPSTRRAHGTPGSP
jgi:hypothetical protein